VSKTELIERAGSNTRQLPITRLRNSKKARDDYMRSMAFKMFMYSGFGISEARAWAKKVGGSSPRKVADTIWALKLG